MPRSRSVRFLTLLFAALQFAAPGYVSAVDGERAQTYSDGGSHVEEVGQNLCSPPHAADCTACRFLSGNACDAPTAGACIVPTDVAPAPAKFIATGAAASRIGFNSRAPPPLLG